MRIITSLLVIAALALTNTGFAGKPYDSGPPVIAKYEQPVPLLFAQVENVQYEVFNPVEYTLFEMSADVTIAPLFYDSGPWQARTYDYINDVTFYRQEPPDQYWTYLSGKNDWLRNIAENGRYEYDKLE